MVVVLEYVSIENICRGSPNPESLGIYLQYVFSVFVTMETIQSNPDYENIDSDFSKKIVNIKYSFFYGGF